MTDDLVVFLRARLAEEEAGALAASPGPWHLNAEQDTVLAVDGIEVTEAFALSSQQLRATAAHIARHDPAHVLRNVAAGRRIMARHTTPAHDPSYPDSCAGCGDQGEHSDAGNWDYPRVERINDCPELRDLAAVYDDHPDYQEAWRPVE